MFERYTEKARRVIFFSRYEASEFGAHAIEPEHILLGLLREDYKLFFRRLPGAPGSVIDSIRKEIERATIAREKTPISVDLPLSPGAKGVLTYAADESERLGHRYIGTAHLLLGILREGKSVAAQILLSRGLQLNQLRDEVKRTNEKFFIAAPPTEYELRQDLNEEDSRVNLDAAMTTTAKGTFDVTLTPLTSDAPPLGRLKIDKVFHGDIEGLSTGEMLTAGTEVQGSAGYVAIECVNASLQGRKGSFVLQHSGTMNRGRPSLKITVVPDSGTDELKGLTGELEIVIAEDNHFFEFHYQIAE